MVIISNGFSKFHLAVAAAEADRRQSLSAFLTGAYPTSLVRRIFSLPYLKSNAKANRLVARREPVADGLVHTLFSSEVLYALGTLTNSEAATIASLRLYGWSAIRHVKQAAAEGARIYHYRAGFGGASVEVARKCGMFVLCDHSIAHPLAVDTMVKNKGSMPTREEAVSASPFWRYVLGDIERSDAVLVNSCFVEDTFRHLGHNRLPIHVIYWGVDDAFLAQAPERKSPADEFCMLFAGNFEVRKGACVLMEALENLDHIPWRLDIAGPASADLAERNRIFFANPRVNYLGTLSRRDLAFAMARADVFVFPSFAEGSARVVFEALACGCYVITTPNSGSIVEDGIHGAIVSPGNSALLASAIEDAYYHREKVWDIGERNARCVRAKYRQCDYGDQLSTLYKGLLGDSFGGGQRDA